MRVIRTEEYFDPSEVQWDYEELAHGNPGIGVAFIKTSKPGPVNLNDIDRFTVNMLPMAGATPDLNIDQFLNAAIQGADLWSANKLMTGSEIPEQPLIQLIRKLDVIIEASPPTFINFNALLKTAGPAVAIGTFVGISAASYPILLATVPAGIVIVGAAIAISKIFQDGLPKAVERYTSGSRRRPQKAKPARP